MIIPQQDNLWLLEKPEYTNGIALKKMPMWRNPIKFVMVLKYQNISGAQKQETEFGTKYVPEDGQMILLSVQIVIKKRS